MKREELLDAVAPCGLNCRACLARQGGEINELSRSLKSRLGNFKALAPRFAVMNPVFGQYDGFAAVLDFFAQGTCTGCRSGSCLYGECLVQKCVRDRAVDFCFECGEFPCDRTGFPEMLRARWENNNRKMKELGAAGFWVSVKDLPRY